VSGLSAFDVSCCSPFDDSTPPAPQVSNRATADDNWRSKLVRLLECGQRQKAQHTTHNVGMIVVTIARVLDGVFAGTMRAPLKQAKLANEPRIVGQPRQTAREHRQAFEVDGAFRPRTADVFKLKFAPSRRHRHARPKKVGRIFGPRRWISAVPDWR